MFVTICCKLYEKISYLPNFSYNCISPKYKDYSNCTIISIATTLSTFLHSCKWFYNQFEFPLCKWYKLQSWVSSNLIKCQLYGGLLTSALSPGLTLTSLRRSNTFSTQISNE